MNRWRMNKLGFVNFWLYDREEFSLEDGHLLLRGANASGKSIATQSFIPFLLDGNRSPERLDPFGSRDRKMDFYLLGDGDREESTGYLYMEFQKGQLNEYITIGVGMRAQKGKHIDFWGFCLNDGRRIGEDGVQLYETIGRQLLPLSKQKLKNLIGNSDCWAENQGAYKEMVNKHIFRFEDIRQYDQLLGLLIKVRISKLSKDAFRPSDVKKILKDSLQVLTDEDLSAMVSIMEHADAIEATLQDYKQARQDAMTIRNEYDRYNQFILGAKGKAYMEAIEKRRRLNSQLEQVRGEAADKAKELEEQSGLAERAGTLLAQAKAQRVAMGEDDLTAKQNQLENEQENRHRHEELCTGTEQSLKQLDGKIQQGEAKLRRHQQEHEDVRFKLQSHLKKLGDQERILLLGEDYQAYAEQVQLERADEQAYQRVYAALSRRTKQIDEVLKHLEMRDEAREKHDSTCQQLEQAVSAHATAESELRATQRREQDARDELIEALIRRQDANQELLFSREEMGALRDVVSRYRSHTDWIPARQLISDCNHRYSRALLAESAQMKQELQEKIDRRTQLEDALKSLRSQPVPTPSRRRPSVGATRNLLTMRGVPHTAFYEAVDFSQGLSQEAQDRLEAQLADAGLLDALLVPEEHLPQLVDLLADYPDSFLIPGAPVQNPIEALIPDVECPHSFLAEQYLRGISCADLDGQTALLPDGTFRNGTLRGRSQAECPAGFVGATARRANLERQLRQLEEEIEATSLEQAHCQTALDEISRRSEVLETEYTLMPSTEELDRALEALSEARRAVASAQSEVQKYGEAERAFKFQLDTLEQTCRSLSVGLPYDRTVDDYEEAQGAAQEYLGCLHNLNNTFEKLKNMVDLMDEVVGSVATLRENAAQQRQSLNKEKLMLSAVDAKIWELTMYLERPENQRRAERLAELAEEIEAQRAAQRAAELKCAGLEKEIGARHSESARIQENLTDAAIEENELERYFQEDMDLGFPKPWVGNSLTECARQAQAKIPANDRARTPEDLGSALRRNYEAHNNSLHKYLPMQELTFESPARPGQLRQRQTITFQRDGKRISLYEFIEALQAEIAVTETALEENERRLFEDILHETISHKLRAHIEESQQWSKDMSALMKALVTSMGLTFSLDWRAKKAMDESEMDTTELVMLLNKDRHLLTPEDSRRATQHFRAKIKQARQEAEAKELSLNYADMIRTVLDYRTWYEFFLYYTREGEDKKELTDRAFNRFSGGEKAMAIYLPQFAAVYAQYKKGSPSSPMLLALDEAFAGVDDKNIDAMFELVHKLGFNYIMNSQALWGCYSCVPSLDIAEFHRPNNAQVVTILRYRWNGREKILQED